MDKLTKEKRSWNMAQIKAVNTNPEVTFRKSLFKLGFRYRIHYKITGKPDIVFVKNKVAVFVHGCFWHVHGCNNSSLPKSNSEFWKNKLNKNVQRDKTVKNELMKQGWKVFVIWECQIEDSLAETTQKLSESLLRADFKMI